MPIFEDQERTLLSRMLLNAFQQKEMLPKIEMELATFAAMKGELFQRELMVVGRAVNGWKTECKLEQLQTPDGRAQVVEETLRVSNAVNRCPLLWVSDDSDNCDSYNTRKSAFWRVVRCVVRDLGIADIVDQSWPSHLIWTNLYKLAPAVGRNPSTTLVGIQFQDCLELLEAEVTEWKPKRILLLTGIDWAEGFLSRLRAIETSVVKGSFVEFVGDLDLTHDGQRTRVVVAKHPERKPQAAFVREVSTAFQ